MIFGKWNKWVTLGVLLCLCGSAVNIVLRAFFPWDDTRDLIIGTTLPSLLASEALIIFGLLQDWGRSSYVRLLLTSWVILVVGFTDLGWIASASSW
jgi:hypothetical protein